MYNILIGGAAGQGVDTTSAILERLLKRSGYHVHSTRDVMSRVRGGHNFTLIRFGREEIASHSYRVDGIVAFNQETAELHRQELKPGGFILCDSHLPLTGGHVVQIDMDDIARSLGNPKVFGSVAIGAILKLFGVTLDYSRDVLAKFMNREYLDVNLKAVAIGYERVERQYIHEGGADSGRMLLSGNQALALGAMTAGLKFYSAYPMSPSTSIMEYLAGKMTEAGFVVEQAEDEIAAVNMAIGAAFAGARAMTGTSGGGFSLMVEGLGLSGMAEIPLVVVDVQRPGPTTGLPTRTEQSDLKFVISASQGEFPRMVIAVRSHADAFYQTIRAFNIAEKYQIPVIILSDQYLADSSATVAMFDSGGTSPCHAANIPAEGEYLRYRFTEDGISPRLIPGTARGFVTADSDEHDERGWIIESAEQRVRMMDKRLRKLQKLELELQEPEFIGSESYDTLLLGWGSTYGPVKEAITLLNRQSATQYAALIFGDIYPLPVKRLLEKAQKAKQLINIEQNATGQLADLIRAKTGIACTASILKYDGRQISGEQIVEQVLRGAGK